MKVVSLRGVSLKREDIPVLAEYFSEKDTLVRILEFEKADNTVRQFVASCLFDNIQCGLRLFVNSKHDDALALHSAGTATETSPVSASARVKSPNPRPGCDCGGGHARVPCRSWCSLEKGRVHQ